MLPREKPNYPGKNQTTQGKTKLPREKPNYPGENQTTLGKTKLPRGKPNYLGNNQTTQGKTSWNRILDPQTRPTCDTQSRDWTCGISVGDNCCHHCTNGMTQLTYLFGWTADNTKISMTVSRLWAGNGKTNTSSVTSHTKAWHLFGS